MQINNLDSIWMDLGLESHAQFQFLCIVSGNDYSKNIPGIRLNKAFKWLKNQIHLESFPESVLEIVSAFLTDMEYVKE